MEVANLFAQMPSTPEPIIAQVRRQLVDDAREGMTLEANVLDYVADRAVRELWGSRVKTFVPILALREAREILREQGSVITAERPEMDYVEGTPPTGPRQVERASRDFLRVDGDMLSLDDRDVLPQ